MKNRKFAAIFGNKLILMTARNQGDAERQIDKKYTDRYVVKLTKISETINVPRETFYVRKKVRKLAYLKAIESKLLFQCSSLFRILYNVSTDHYRIQLTFKLKRLESVRKEYLQTLKK